MASVLEVSSSIGGAVASLNSNSFHEFGDSQLHLDSNETGYTNRRTSGVFSALTYNIIANATTGAGNVATRKNSVNVNQVFSIGAGLTGVFQDLVHTDTVVAGDVFNVETHCGLGGTMSIGTIGVHFSATSNTVKRLNHTPDTNPHTPTTTIAYCPVAGGDSATVTTESNNQYKVRTPATLKNLFAYVSANTNSQAISVISRKNTANGNLSLSAASGLTGTFEDLVHSDTLASGDLINYAYSVGATNTGTSSLARVATEFVTDNGQSEMFGENSGSTVHGTSLTWFHPLAGLIKNHSVAETDAQTAGLGATASQLQLRLTSNTVSAASTFNLRKNAGNGNQSISITASTSGLYEDAVNSDVLLDSDLINYQLITGGTGTSLSPTVMGILLTVFGIPVGTLSPRFVFFDTGQYSLGA